MQIPKVKVNITVEVDFMDRIDTIHSTYLLYTTTAVTPPMVRLQPIIAATVEAAASVGLHVITSQGTWGAPVEQCGELLGFMGVFTL